jgi:hypothetical protein
MHSFYDGLIIFIPTVFAVLFLLWALWNFSKARGRR